ncbi:MAG: pyrroline-5-carboxylate reductase [Woeseiaceae bacterium]|jgi:pyrroline-5-carboxylate reductase|nr:pyrroline-5-carboxylate reductase [Woeseiaceae bacterium]
MTQNEPGGHDRVAFIGGGNMTRAIVLGMLRNAYPPDHILISEPDADRRAALEAEMNGITLSASNADVARRADTVVLAVKPQVLPAACSGLATTVQASRPLIVSIAAGTRGADIDAWLGGNLAVVRVMPNQPALLGLGVAGLVGNERAREPELERAERIIEATGTVVRVDSEAEIDAVTAVSGSGPAYFFLLIDMLAKGGAQLGLDADTALTLAIETARGAAAIAREEDESMEALIARVRSPGGTTAAALDSLDADGIRGIFERALEAARDRAAELAGS